MRRAEPKTNVPKTATSANTGCTELDAYDELRCYTLTRGDRAFVHQHVVDAWTAQHADERTKPIAITFALIGLYLHVEKGFSGRQVQRAHMALARQKRNWLPFALPRERGSFTAREVMATPAGPERDDAIDVWCESVWAAFRDSRSVVMAILDRAATGCVRVKKLE